MSPRESEYPPRPATQRLSASARGWGNGWPHCQSDKLVTLSRRDGLRLPVRQDLAELVTLLLDETEALGYDVTPGETWGFACRAIGGTSTPSNHSWGLALDVNAPRNPQSSTFRSDMPVWLPKLWWDYKFFWGGWYSGTKDPMHFEFLGTPADARALTQKAKQELKAKPHPYPLPGEKSVKTRQAQKMLKRCGFDPGEIDGICGKMTAAAVKAFEESHPRLKANADGLFGPLTWRFLVKAFNRSKKAQAQV